MNALFSERKFSNQSLTFITIWLQCIWSDLHSFVVVKCSNTSFLERLTTKKVKKINIKHSFHKKCMNIIISEWTQRRHRKYVPFALPHQLIFKKKKLSESENNWDFEAPPSWNKTCIFTASTITQYWLYNTIIIISFSDNATIIYRMKETNSCFLRIGSKAPVRILGEKMKIKVSSV